MGETLGEGRTQLLLQPEHEGGHLGGARGLRPEQHPAQQGGHPGRSSVPVQRCVKLFLDATLNTFYSSRQSVVSGVTTAYNREQLWLANETLIAKLQARCRGYLVRKGQKERMDFLTSQDPAVTRIQVRDGQTEPEFVRRNFRLQQNFIILLILNRFYSQAHWKGYKQRRKFKDRKQYLKDHSDEAVKVKLSFYLVTFYQQ